MKVLVCGSRDWTDRTLIYDILDGLLLIHGRELELIHGAARGADRIAAERAERLGVKVTPFPADWSTYPGAAGIIRNLTMLDQRPDLVIAFQKDGSTGTQHTVDEARRRGIPVQLYEARS